MLKMDLEDEELQVLDYADSLLENFAEEYLMDALRILNTKLVRDEDYKLMYNAVCIVTTMYMEKIKNGEIHQNRVLH